ncbi:hypothetical protein PG993_002063 [Apiospora rasikravindrae]|uniref:Uncharacterized protein n=1 Tax=Apiospora rasikravindrae TaxID=990691 RepID=A0ABR1UD62_9PEZI
MPTAKGSFSRTQNTLITATFVIDERQWDFIMTISSSIVAFTSNGAELTYNDLDELTSTRSFNGTIGREDFSIDLDNGLKITGKLNKPYLMERVGVDGTGKWVQH